MVYILIAGSVGPFILVGVRLVFIFISAFKKEWKKCAEDYEFEKEYRSTVLRELEEDLKDEV